jgi:hypothetical protein
MRQSAGSIGRASTRPVILVGSAQKSVLQAEVAQRHVGEALAAGTRAPGNPVRRSRHHDMVEHSSDTPAFRDSEGARLAAIIKESGARVD